MSLQSLGSLLCLFFSLGADAQTILQGRVLELGSSVPIAGVKVTNTGSGASTFSDALGQFKIKASKNNVIALNLYLYVPDSIFLTDVNRRDFFLEPVSHQLKTVAIKGVKTELGTLVDKETYRKSTGYQRNDDGTIKGGLVFRLRYWNKDSKKERRSQRKIKEYLIEEEIDRVFSVSYIERYTPLKGNELLDFRSLYRPTVKLYISPGFNLLFHLNSSYREFKSLPPEERKLPKLEPFDPRYAGI